MSARTRILVMVGAAMIVGVAAIVLVAGREGDADGRSAAREGAPPLALDLGVRTDPEATALRRAAELYDQGRRQEAADIFERYGSAPARVGAAFAAWPAGTVAQLEGLAQRIPRNSLVLLNLGLARFWSGDDRGAAAAWLDAYDAQPDTASALVADRMLHPDTPEGMPIFVPGFPAPAPAGTTPAAQIAALRRDAQKRDVRARLLYGIALQRLGRQRSAERMYASAVPLAPQDPEPRVAAAVARFSRSEPARAFSQLGPLSRRYPRDPTVRFHLGLLFAWLGQIDAAEQQFARARRIDSQDPLGREAARWLDRLRKARRASAARTQESAR